MHQIEMTEFQIANCEAFCDETKLALLSVLRSSQSVESVREFFADCDSRVHTNIVRNAGIAPVSVCAKFVPYELSRTAIYVYSLCGKHCAVVNTRYPEYFVKC